MKNKLVGVGAAVALLLAGCSKPSEIGGQVFIVRGDRETIRITGAPVFLIDASLSNKLAQIIAGIDAHKSLLEMRSDEVMKMHSELISREDKLLNEQRKAHSKVVESKREIDNLRLVIESSAYSMVTMTARQREGQVRTNQVSLAKLKQLRAEKLEPLEEDLAKIKKEGIEVRGQIEALDKELLSVLEALKDNGREGAIYGADLTSASVSTMTDADGRFQLKANLKENPLIVVRAHRKVPNGTEYYFWMEPVRPTNVILSNLNIKRSHTEKDENENNENN